MTGRWRVFPLGGLARKSFKRQIILTFVIGSLLVIACFVAYILATERSYLYRDNTDEAAKLADTLAVSSVSWVLARDLAGLGDVVSSFRGYPHVRYAMVLSPRGRVLAHTDQTKVGQFVLDERSLGVLKGVTQNQVVAENAAMIDVAVPIRFKTWRIGWARIGLERGQISNRLRMMIRDSALFALFAASLSLFAALVIANRLGRHIGSLVRVADLVRGGDRQVRADTSQGPEEITRLGQSFNHMLDALLESKRRYRSLFEEVPVSLWEEDFSEVKRSFDELRASGVTDFRRYFDDHPQEVGRLADQVIVGAVNRETLRLFGAADTDTLHRGLSQLFLPESLEAFKEELVALADGKRYFHRDAVVRSLSGERIEARLDLSVPQGYEESLSRVLACISDITERKRFEEELRRSEERYRIVADFTNDWEYWQGPDGELLYVSPSCEAITGYRPEEFAEAPALLAHIVHPDDVAAFTHHLQHTRDDIGPSTTDFRIMRRDGEVRWISHVCRPVARKDGTYLGRRVSNRDITERKKLEARLADSAAYARELIEASPDPLIILSLDGRITDANRAAEEVSGVQREQSIGTDYASYTNEPEKARQAFMQALAVGSAKDVSLSIRHVSGTAKEFLFNGVVLKNAAGEPKGVLAIARDITERKEMEARLAEAAAYARTLFDTSPDPLLTVATDGIIREMNPVGAAAAGFPREEMIGTHFTKYCADPEQAQRDFAKGIAAGYAKGVHLPIRHVSGTVTEFLVSAAPLRSPSGEIQVLISGRDITELNRLEKELRELNLSLEQRIEEEVARSREKDQKLIEQSQRAARELQAVNESLERRVHAEVQASREKDHMLIQQSRLAAMGEMVHNIAHQWRQPLQGLSIILGNIRDGYALHELTQGSLDAEVARAHTLLKRMSTTVDDFRDFFRPDREPAEFEMGDAVRDALSVMDATLKDNHIEVVTSLSAGLRAYGYHNQFAQAILNVIANAKEVIQERKVPDGRIEIGLVQSAGSGVLSIQDNGGGIPEAALPKIFDPYFTTKAQGSGIGLYMAKVIIERNHGGSIEAANVGPGARFTLSLPLRIERPSA